MSFTLKDIKGALIYKKQLEGIGEYITGKEVGRNELIDEQSQVRLQLKREKLAEVLYEDWQRQENEPMRLKWADLPDKTWRNCWYELADALISAIDKNPSEYIERVKE